MSSSLLNSKFFLKKARNFPFFSRILFWRSLIFCSRGGDRLLDARGGGYPPIPPHPPPSPMCALTLNCRTQPLPYMPSLRPTTIPVLYMCTSVCVMRGIGDVHTWARSGGFFDGVTPFLKGNVRFSLLQDLLLTFYFNPLCWFFFSFVSQKSPKMTGKCIKSFEKLQNFLDSHKERLFVSFEAHSIIVPPPFLAP